MDIRPGRFGYWRKDTVPFSELDANASFKWLGSDREETFRKQGHPFYDENSISYDLNSRGYRSDEFHYDPDELRIVTFGCSIMFGIGLPQEETMGERLRRRLSDHFQRPVRLYNLSLGGSGNDHAAMLAYQTCGVLKPDFALVLWTFLHRMQHFTPDGEQRMLMPMWYPKDYQQEHAAYLRLINDTNSWMNFVRDFQFVNMTFEKHGVPWLYSKLEFQSSYLIDEFLRPELLVPPYDFWQQDVVKARDHSHPGRDIHAAFADRVFEQIVTRKMLG